MKRVVSVLAVMAIMAAMLVVTAGPALAAIGPTSKEACKQNKAQIKDVGSNSGDNQGQCIQFVKQF